MEGLITMMHAVLLGVFVNYVLVYKRPAFIVQGKYKPGQQCLNFLQWCSAAFWLWNTFLLKHWKLRFPYYYVFGKTGVLIFTE